MTFTKEDLEAPAPKSTNIEERQTVDQMDGVKDGEHGPNPLYFQPSAESLSIFDQAKSQCAQGVGIRGGLGLAKVLRPGSQKKVESTEEVASSSTEHAADYVESLEIFGETNRQCDDGNKTLRGLTSDNQKNTPSGPSVGNERAHGATGATAALNKDVPKNGSAAVTNIDRDGLGDVGQRAVDCSSQAKVDAAKWCSLVRQHQAQANYLSSRCRREFVREQKRVRQPFTPRDRYRSPPRRSVASACWEGWCADEKVLASMREEVKAARQTNSEFSSGRRFADWFESARRRFGGAVSWLSTKIRAVWDGVYRLASWVDCFKI